MPAPVAYQEWTELVVPVTTPLVGRQLVYVKAGVGVCSKDSSGVEHCPGGGGGGSGTVTSVDCQAGLTCTPDPIVAAGTIKIDPGAITDAMLANNYSGVGPCTNQFVRALNDNAAPTCDTVAMATDVGTFSSATLAGRLTDETGTSLAVFNTTPSFATNITINGVADQPALVFGNIAGNQTTAATSNIISFGNNNISTGYTQGIDNVADWTVTGSPTVVATGGFVRDNIRWKNDAGNARTFTGVYSYAAHQRFTADTATVTMNNGAFGAPATAAFYILPSFQRIGTPTGNTAAQYTGLYLDAGTVDTGWLVTDYRGLKITQPSGSGVVTNLVGIDISALTKGATLNHSLRSTGEQTMVHDGAVRIGDNTVPVTTDGLEVVGIIEPRVTVANNPGTTQAIQFDPSYTLSSGTNAVRTLLSSPTVTYNGGTSQSTTTLNGSPTINISAAATTQQFINMNSSGTILFNAASTATNFAPTAFREGSTYTASNVAAGSTGNIIGFNNIPTVRSTGASGTITFPNVYSFHSKPVLTTNNASGTATITTMRHFSAEGVAASGAGTETVTTEIGVDLSGIAGVTSISLQSDSLTATMRHTGSAGFGIPVANAPAAVVEAQAGVLGNEVMRIDGVPAVGTDAPTEQTFQCELQTTDATQTDCFIIGVASGKVRTMEATVVAHCTAGASCTANNGAAYKVVGTCKNNAGTTGAVTGSPTVLISHEDVNWDATIDCDNTGDTARLRLTGAGTTTILWHATIRTMQVGS